MDHVRDGLEAIQPMDLMIPQILSNPRVLQRNWKELEGVWA